MPIHLDDVDIAAEVAGLRSALIVPCNMCPAITTAVNDGQPFLQLFRHFLKSAPFDDHIRTMQSQLEKKGIRTQVFASSIPYQWFLCMWTAGHRKKLRQSAGNYDAVIVLGCDSATATVRDAVDVNGTKVIEGMRVVGFLNAKMRVRFPGNVCFDDCTMVPMAPPRRENGASA